jgi:hypothetical protein
MDAETVARFLYEDILMNYGGCYEIISDRGSALLAEATKIFEQMQQIRHHASTAYHPQTNGMVERMHATLGSAITKLSDGERERWDEFLPQTLFSIRVRTHAVTKHSPFYLLYGMHPRLPGDTRPPRPLVPLDELEQLENREEIVARTFDELGLARKAAYERSKAQARRMKAYQDERRGIEDPSQTHAFGVGDMVKMKHHEKEKFEFNWKGPYYVTRLGPPGTY